MSYLNLNRNPNRLIPCGPGSDRLQHKTGLASFTMEAGRPRPARLSLGVIGLLIACACTALAETKYEFIDEAIARGDAEDVKAHLEANPETVNQGKHPRMSPLQQAIMRNKPEIAVILIEAGADINKKDNSQRTPLHLAVDRKNAAVIEALLKHKAQPNERDKVGWTPLHHAAAKDSVEVAKALLDGGAEPTTLSEGGGTPLHEAAASGGAEMVELLLAHEVDPSVISKTGETALAIAERRENQAALDALRAATASKE